MGLTNPGESDALTAVAVDITGVALFESRPPQSGVPTGEKAASEGYDRVTTNNTEWDVNPGDPTELVNNVPIPFPNPTADYPLPITHVGICVGDTPGAGTVKGEMEIRTAGSPSPITVLQDNPVVFQAGELKITLSLANP